MKHRPDLITTRTSTAVPSTANESPEPERLAKDLEKLGPTFVKLGQVLSTRADLLPPPYLEALSRLQDHIAPFPLADVQETIETDLGGRISKGVLTFDADP